MRMHPTPMPLVFALFLGLLLAGCELVVDFDRSRIPPPDDAGLDPSQPDASVGPSASSADGGSSIDGGDASSTPGG